MNGPRIQYVYVERRVPARRRGRIMVPTWVSVVSIAAAILWSIYYVVNTI